MDSNLIETTLKRTPDDIDEPWLNREATSNTTFR